MRAWSILAFVLMGCSSSDPSGTSVDGGHDAAEGDGAMADGSIADSGSTPMDTGKNDSATGADGGAPDTGATDTGIAPSDGGSADPCASVTCPGPYGKCCYTTGKCYDTRCLACCMP